MKKKLLINTFREVIKSKSRFISIFLIIALGSGFFAGLKATSPNMVRSVASYFEEYNLMDVNLKSASLFKNDDVNTYKLDEVEEIELSKELIDIVKNIENEYENIKIIGYRDDLKINKLDIVKGRLPIEEDEAVIEYNTNSDIIYEIGDEISIKNFLLKRNVYKIVGIVRSPMYLSNNRNLVNDSNSSNLFISIYESNILLDGYTDLYMTLKKKYLPYSDEYKEYVSEVTKKINIIKDENTYQFTRFDIIGYKSFYDDAMKVDIIATVIPIFFALIALLVSITTIIRMVDEQRIEIGTLFSLGYKKKDIWLKYFIYAMIPTFLGTLFGVVFSILVLPPIIFNAYKMSYIIPDIVVIFRFDYLFVSLGIAIVCTTLSTTFSLIKLLKEPPANLLRSKNIKSGNKILLERISFIWKRISFNWKMTLRNLLRFKRRTIITIFGIAGCSGLMLTCLGINSSINKINDKQDNIIIYDGLVIFSDEESVSKLDSFDELGYLKINQLVLNVDGDDTDITMMIIDGNISKYIKLKNRITKKDLSLQDGVIITEGVASKLNIKVNDLVKFIDDTSRKYELKISGISENYINNYLFISKDFFESLYGQVSMNRALFNTPNIKDVKDVLLNDSNVLILSIRKETSKFIINSLSNMSFLVAIMIVSSAVLGIVVLYNLSNINITERANELCTIKVMGFTDYEVNNYINRENYIYTFFGIIFGIVISKYFEEYIIRIIQTNNIFFIRDFSIGFFILGVGLTIIFTILVNILLYFKVKRLNMVDAMKFVE